LASEGADAVLGQAAALRQLSAMSRHLLVAADKLLAKELTCWDKRLRALPGMQAEASLELTCDVLTTLEAAQCVSRAIGTCAPA
jgi:hypothetical protein